MRRQNLVDRVVSFFSPVAGVRRMAARNLLEGWDGAQPSRLRKFHRDRSSADRLVTAHGVPLRTQARDLERNHDLARGALRVLVNNIVGPSGIGIEPQPRVRGSDEINTEYAAALREAWRDWQKVPEVTHRHNWSKVQRMVARTWIRDGEAFAQSLIGNVQYLDHGTRVPFSLELLEPDMVPMDYSNNDDIRQGIRRNAWGRPVSYFFYKYHPGDLYRVPTIGDLKEVEAGRVLHVAALDRIGQMRGVSEFASIITRLEDVKDYEESERIAAKIAAALTAYVKRGTPDLYDGASVERDEHGNPIPRDLSLQPGTIIDTLGIGEEIGLIDSSRPNQNAVGWRQGQLRAVAAGLGASYSSVARDYNGTYSAQRQELVEQWVNYAVLTDDFCGMFVQKPWELFVFAAHVSGVVRRPKDVDPLRADDALFIGQSMPWIDPMREAKAWNSLVRDGFASEAEVIRRRGANPRDVIEQIDAFRKKCRDKGLVFASDAANDKQPPVQVVDQPAP